MSSFGDYIAEIKGQEIIEVGNCFLTYAINGENAYIEEIYVDKQNRRQGMATKMCDLAVSKLKDKNVTHLYGSIVPFRPGVKPFVTSLLATQSLQAMLSYGFRVHSAKDNFILLVKEIG